MRIRTKSLLFQIQWQGSWYIHEKRTDSYLCQKNGHVFLSQSTGWNKSVHTELYDAPGWYRTRTECQKVVEQAKKQKTILRK